MNWFLKEFDAKSSYMYYVTDNRILQDLVSKWIFIIHVDKKDYIKTDKTTQEQIEGNGVRQPGEGREQLLTDWTLHVRLFLISTKVLSVERIEKASVLAGILLLFSCIKIYLEVLNDTLLAFRNIFHQFSDTVFKNKATKYFNVFELYYFTFGVFL